MPDKVIVLATLLKVEGNVKVKIKGKGIVNGYSGMVLPYNIQVTIETGENGKVDIVSNDGARISLKPNNSFFYYKSVTPGDNILPNVVMDVDEMKRGLGSLRGNKPINMATFPCV